jgi:hypothetical protein
MALSEAADLTTIATFTSGVEAAIAQQALAAAGIEAYVHGDAMAPTMWHLGVALGGVKLQGAAVDAAEALALLEEARSGSFADDELGEDDEDTESEIALAASAQDDAVHRALKAAIFGLLFPPLTFYAGWLLLQMRGSDATLSAKNRRHLSVAAMLVLIAIGWYLFCLTVFVRSFSEPVADDGHHDWPSETYACISLRGFCMLTPGEREHATQEEQNISS